MKEFTPQEDTKEVWDAAMTEKDVPESKRHWLGWVVIEAMPPGANEPEQIVLTTESMGSSRDVTRTLTLTSTGPVSYEYRNFHWNGDSDADEHDFFGSDDPRTLERLDELAARIKESKKQNPNTSS